MSGGPWRVRRVDADDEDTYAEIIALDAAPEFFGGCYWTRPRESTLLLCEAHTRHGWELAGYASYRRASPDPGDASTVYLDRAAVLPAYRGRGLQRRLIRRRCVAAREEGATHAITYTMHGLAVSANNLIACGFRKYAPAYPWAGAAEDYWYKRLIPRGVRTRAAAP